MKEVLVFVESRRTARSVPPVRPLSRNEVRIRFSTVPSLNPLDFRAEIPMLSPVIQPMTKGRRCALCNKGPLRGEQITRRGLAKSQGGVGRKITGRSKRSFKPNLQKVRAVVDGKT